MLRERYPGEQRGLTLFLEELLPVVAAELGKAHLLHHAIRRALRLGTLQSLRHARQLFNNLPREQKQHLSQGLVGTSERIPSTGDLLEAYAARAPEPYVCFDARLRSAEALPPVVRLRHELVDSADVRVMVRPGTLPSEAAEQLRTILATIERDRRLLSQRFWDDRQRPVTDGHDESAEHG